MRNQSYRGIYHGWFIVAAAMFIALVSMGPRVGFGLFVIPMSDDFGWSRSAISLAGTVAAIVGGCTQPVLGRIFDIVGGRKLMLTGLSVFAVSTLLLAFTNHIIYLIIVFGVLMAVGGSAGTMNTAAALVSKWFHRRRATAIALIASGGSLGGLILVPFIAFIMPIVGWRNTWMILGATVLFLALPMAFLMIKNDPSEVGKLPDGDDDIAGDLIGTNVPRGPLEVDYWLHAFKSMPLWQLCGGYFVCGVTTTMMATHYVPYAIEEGFSASTAATAFAVLSALNMIGVLGAGFLGDRVGRKNLLAFIYGMRGVGYAVLVTAPGLWGLYGFAIIGGFSWLATIPLTISLTSEVYGLRNIGTLSGIVFMAHQIGGAMSVQFAGIMKDVTGEYTIPFAIGGLLLAFASVASFSIREKEYSSRYQSFPKVVSA